MERKFDEDQIKDIVKQTLILLVSLMLIIGFFKLFYSYSSQRKMISEFENTNIREKLITNNKVANMGKPYKIKDGIVYMPLLELCKNFNTDATYKFTPNGGIELKYRKSTYLLQRGSNEVRFLGNENILKMDGVVVFMDNTVYVPLDFIYKVLDVNVVQSSDGTVYMDNYPKKFNYSWVKENRYIAHAMGGIDGNTYTNSKEAMEKSYERGLRVLETDISLSSDDKLVLIHSFEKDGLAQLGLPVSWASKPPTEKEFLERKILGRYTTMKFSDVVAFMKKHKDVYIVIDLKNNDIKDVEKCYKKIVEIAKKEDQSVLKRIIPQIYYEQMYRPLMNIYDFKSIIFTTYRIEELEVNKIVDFSYEHGIKIVAVNKFKFSKDLTDKLVDRGIGLYMFTYNDESVVNSLRNLYVSGFYTDFLPKDKINRDSDGKVIVSEKKNNTN
ncbi:glycerophosphodiester phosphodiesterase family protein [Peptostreptococcus porci]|uniref:glycerophosphodiester phosphodiesterase family protein n=1 Tax=Peptostreptococcus porci TaxID=2652282 RepID=UPI002A91B995|nr:glycerophosphodiester phosphodiesterase family protein [Peptostreptococcus porci]MDY5437115.1 glycerophosphodiester phosphodiesterase family protein [Peptostreptococcus porci]